MPGDVILDIVRLCRKIDETACLAYIEMAKHAGDPALKSFWNQMAREEQEHVTFWRRVGTQANESNLPQVFDDPGVVKSELERSLPKAQALLEECLSARKTAACFLLAYRLEFYLLHPAFGTLFSVLKSAGGGTSPIDDYEEHINRFVSGFSKFGQTTPEMELIGETLQRLWRENVALTHRATTDDLTGLLTRQAFAEIALHLAHLARRQNNEAGVIMIDLDHFKNVNDTHGHQKGDEVLRDVADIVKACVRGADACGRYGGEEFVIFMPETVAGAAPLVAERIREAVDSAKPAGLDVTVSLGLATGAIGEDPGASIEELVGRADKCLYRAKEGGRNRVVSEQAGPTSVSHRP
jgi:diguanylate cyclase (GGDEF)-like protein